METVLLLQFSLLLCCVSFCLKEIDGIGTFCFYKVLTVMNAKLPELFSSHFTKKE